MPKMKQAEFDKKQRKRKFCNTIFDNIVEFGTKIV
jgi:hypothetical protein